MISDERFDELVKRAGTLATDTYQTLPESECGRIFTTILDHLIANETWGQGFRFNNPTATGITAGVKRDYVTGAMPEAEEGP